MDGQPRAADLELLERVLDLVVGLHGPDLRDYRRDTLQRRLGLRLAATGLPGEAYLARLRTDPGEVERLLAALVVPVSQFYRDPEVFDALATVVLPDLLAKSAGAGLRAWSAGTATGEEAWTMAMLLASACPGRSGFSVLGSDLDPRSLALATAGVYPVAALAGLPAGLRSAWLVPCDGGARLADALRPHVVFARHDLAGRQLAPNEAVVARFDVILCRNVLIYMEMPLQARVRTRLAGMLSPGGALVLGPAELPGPEEGLEAWPGLDPALRIYRRRGEG